LIPCGSSLSSQKSDVTVDKKSLIEEELAQEMTAFDNTGQKTTEDDVPVEPNQ